MSGNDISVLREIFHTTPSLLFTLAPLTVENILTAVQGVPWRKLGKKLIYGTLAQSNYPLLDDIETQHQSDESFLHAVIECWLRWDKDPSWRALIWRLDDANETRTADNIRHFAELLPGKP